MSLPNFDTQGTLFGSMSSVAPSLFADNDRFRLFAQTVWPVLAGTRQTLKACYCTTNGRAGVEPVVLLGVLIFQYLERVPDRQAMELVKYHLGWKLALNLDLQHQGFHPTTLVYFRQRLLANDKADLAFRAVVEALEKEGFVPKRGKQRLDSTHIVGAVARLSSLECVRETIRLAIGEIEPKLQELPHFWPLLRERYVENKLDYRSPEPVLKDKLALAGADIRELLEWLDAAPAKLSEGRQAVLLRQVFAEQFTIVEKQAKPQPVKVHATAVVQNPHDPQAHWSAKGHGKKKKDWVGYKVQVAETVSDGALEKGEPTRNFLTSLVTQGSTQSDEAGMVAMMETQASMGQEAPAELYVDGAYVSAAVLDRAQAEGREVVGPAQPSPAKGKGYRTDAFDIAVEERRAVCPAGKTNTQCSRLEEAKEGGRVDYRFEWSKHCRDGLLRGECVSPGQSHRTVVVGEHHSVLQKRRREQKTEAFAERMKQRNAIEGTQSVLVRAHGLRRARYRGLAKVDLQNQMIGAACNIKRWLRVLVWEKSPKRNPINP